MTDVTDPVVALLDADAPGMQAADLVFVFGSTLPDPMEPTVRLLREGLAPVVVLTGGANRRIPSHIESRFHAQLLCVAGVRTEQMIIETESTTTAGNVSHARPLIEARLGTIRTAIVVAKWWHRRAIHLLAAGMPTLERIYAVTWNPPARATGEPYDRRNWSSSSDRARLEGEYAYFKRLLDHAELPTLTRTNDGWCRPARTDHGEASNMTHFGTNTNARKKWRNQ